jgi:formylglycine-generating enzyme required for sulfatase activity
MADRRICRIIQLIFSILIPLCVSVDLSAAQQGPRAAGTVLRDCPDCPEMVVVPQGEFFMGSSDQEIERVVRLTLPADEAKYARDTMQRERPQHVVRFAHQFALSRFRVTRDEFAVFVKETSYRTEGGCTVYDGHMYRRQPNVSWRSPGFDQTGHDPVVCVSKVDADAYSAWLNARAGIDSNNSGTAPYRLPSEAEWEYAARAGTTTARWWGDAIGHNRANCDGCGSKWDGLQPAPNGSFDSNSFGLADVLGNAWEWTADCWNETYNGAPSDARVRTTGDCERGVIRGGAWSTAPWIVRSSTRTSTPHINRNNYTSFRVVRDLK